MATIAAVRDALKVRLATVSSELEVHDTWPELVTPPVAIVIPRRGTWDVAMGPAASRKRNVFFEIVLVSSEGSAPLDVVQDTLDPFIDQDGDSVYGALEGDVTLAGAVDSLRVHEFFDYGVLEIDGEEYFGCKFLVEVYA